MKRRVGVTGLKAGGFFLPSVPQRRVWSVKFFFFFTWLTLAIWQHRVVSVCTSPLVSLRRERFLHFVNTQFSRPCLFCPPKSRIWITYDCNVCVCVICLVLTYFTSIYFLTVYILCVSSCYRQLGLDLVPRREFSMVDPDEISVTELYRLVSGLNSSRDFSSALCGTWFQLFICENLLPRLTVLV